MSFIWNKILFKYAHQQIKENIKCLIDGYDYLTNNDKDKEKFQSLIKNIFETIDEFFKNYEV